MNKLVSLGLLALSLSLLSGSLIAGQVQVCEEIKSDPGYKGLYGLCNAYWNETDPDARADILAAFNRKAGENGPTMPGLSEPPPPPPPAALPSCPCWDFDALVQEIACSGLPLMDQLVDDQAQTGYDFALFQDSSVRVSVYAGYVDPWEPGSVIGSEDGEPECAYFGLAGMNITATNVDNLTDDACRADVLDLIAAPPTFADCDLSP